MTKKRKDNKKKFDNGLNDLRLVAAFMALLGVITIVFNIWDVITVSVDTYVENSRGSIVEYTKDFISNSSDENIDKDEAEYIETKTEANVYMASYIYDDIIYIIIVVVGTIGFWKLTNFFNEKNMENPYDDNVVLDLRKILKVVNKPFVIFIVGVLIALIPETMFFGVIYDGDSYMFIYVILMLIVAAFVKFLISILEKGQLKSKKS